ncbi:32375_t:CDS:1, partial [Gigaspora margarita]
MLKFQIFGLSKNFNSIAATTAVKDFRVIPFIDPQYDKKSDVYSIGVMMWEISSNERAPFNQSNDFVLPLRIIE